MKRTILLMFFIITGIVLSGFSIVSDKVSFATLKTPHFNIIFPKKDSLEIPLIASIAEESYDRLTGYMDIYPKYKVNLVIYDGADFFNGFSTPFPSPTIFIYMNYPDPYFVNGLKNWYRLLITHELTHTLQMTRDKFSRNILFSLIPIGTMPTWYLEGLAVYNESNFSNNPGRLDNVMYRSYLRVFARDDKIPPIMPTMNNFNREFPYGKAYLWGAYAYKEKVAQKGYKKLMDEEKTNDLLRKIGLTQLPFIYYLEYSRYMKKGVKKAIDEAKQELKIMEDIVSSQGEKITEEGYYQILPCFDKRDFTLYYWSSSAEDITYLLSIDKNGKKHKLVEGSAPVSLFLDTLNNYLYYEKIDIYDNSDYYYSIYRYNLKNGKEEKIPNTLRGTNPIIVGDNLFFIYRDIGKNGIGKINLKTGLFKDIFSYPINFQIYGMSVSPDNEYLILSIWSPGGMTSVNMLHIKANKFFNIVNDDYYNINPQMLNDTIFFISDREGTYGIYAYTRKDKKMYRYYLTNGNIRNFYMDKDYIYVSDLSADGWDIYKVDKHNVKPIEINYAKKEKDMEIPVKYNLSMKDMEDYSIWKYTKGYYTVFPFLWLYEDGHNKGFEVDSITTLCPLIVGGAVFSDVLYKHFLGFTFAIDPIYAQVPFFYTNYTYNRSKWSLSGEIILSESINDSGEIIPDDYNYGGYLTGNYEVMNINRSYGMSIKSGIFADTIYAGLAMNFSSAKGASKTIVPVKGISFGVWANTYSYYDSLSVLSDNITVGAEMNLYKKLLPFISMRVRGSFEYGDSVYVEPIGINVFSSSYMMKNYSLYSEGKISMSDTSNMLTGISVYGYTPIVFLDKFNFYYFMFRQMEIKSFIEVFAVPDNIDSYDINVGSALDINFMTRSGNLFAIEPYLYYNYNMADMNYGINIKF